MQIKVRNASGFVVSVIDFEPGMKIEITDAVFVNHKNGVLDWVNNINFSFIPANKSFTLTLKEHHESESAVPN